MKSSFTKLNGATHSSPERPSGARDSQVAATCVKYATRVSVYAVLCYSCV